MKNFYRDVLKNAWQNTWKWKFLWFFGAFAAITSNGEEYDIIVRNFDTITNLEERLQKFKEALSEGVILRAWNNITDFFTNNIFSSILIIFAVIVVVVAVIYLIIISQAAIINAASHFRKGEKTEFFDGFIVGTKYFWPIFILNLIMKIIIYGILIIFGVPLVLLFINTGNFFWLGIFSFIAFIVLIPLSVIISFLVKYSSMYIIIKNKKVWPAIKDSLKLFSKNWLVTIELALVLYVINFFITFFIVGTLTFAQLPFSVVGYLIFLAIVIFVGAIIATFQFSAWAHVFFRLDENLGVSKIMRIFKRKPKIEKSKK